MYQYINFDLDTTVFKEHEFVDRLEPYQLIRGYLESRGFEHDQYSGYRSKEHMSRAQAIAVVKGMAAALPNVSETVRRIRVTETREPIDVTQLLKDELAAKQPDMRRDDRGRRDDGPEDGRKPGGPDDGGPDGGPGGGAGRGQDKPGDGPDKPRPRRKHHPRL